jgi:hypothetical protein
MLGWFGENTANCELRSQQYRSVIGYYLTSISNNAYKYTRKGLLVCRFSKCLKKIIKLLNILQDNCSDHEGGEESDADNSYLAEFDIKSIHNIDEDTRKILMFLSFKLDIYIKDFMRVIL